MRLLRRGVLVLLVALLAQVIAPSPAMAAAYNGYYNTYPSGARLDYRVEQLGSRTAWIRGTLRDLSPTRCAYVRITIIVDGASDPWNSWATCGADKTVGLRYSVPTSTTTTTTTTTSVSSSAVVKGIKIRLCMRKTGFADYGCVNPYLTRPT